MPCAQRQRWRRKADIDFGREPGHHRPVDIEAVPAAGMQLAGGLRILGDRGGGEPAHGFQGLAPDQRRRAAEEGAVPEVEPALDRGVEHLDLARHLPEHAQIVLDRVGIAEEVRRLDQEQALVAEEVGNRVLQDVLGRDVVGVEDEDQVARGARQRGVEVAGLGVLVARPRHVDAAELGAECLQLLVAGQGRGGLGGILVAPLLLAAAVVQQVDRVPARRIVDLGRRQQRRAQELGLLVIGGHVDVDGRHLVRRQRRQPDRRHP